MNALKNPDSCSITIRPAVSREFGEIFTLQRAAYIDEGKLYGTLDVPALMENFDEFLARLSTSSTWVASDNNRIVGAGSLRAHADIPEVERLMVAPDRRGEGICTQLLQAIEGDAVNTGYEYLKLVVGDLAKENQKIYDHLGWKRIDTFRHSEYESVVLHKMLKNLS